MSREPHQILSLQERHFYSLRSLSPCSAFGEIISHIYLQSILIILTVSLMILSTSDALVSAMINKDYAPFKCPFSSFLSESSKGGTLNHGLVAKTLMVRGAV